MPSLNQKPDMMAPEDCRETPDGSHLQPPHGSALLPQRQPRGSGQDHRELKSWQPLSHLWPGSAGWMPLMSKWRETVLGVPTQRRSAPGTGQWPIAAGWSDLRSPGPPFRSCRWLRGDWRENPRSPLRACWRPVAGSPAMGQSSSGLGRCPCCPVAWPQGLVGGAA